MRRSRDVLILVVVGVILSVVALTTDVPDLVIVLLFVIAAVVVHFAFRDGRADD